MLGGYYVYVLWADHQGGPVPFYVGKGHESRYSAHLRACEVRRDIWRSRVIRSLNRGNIQILVSFPARQLSEQDALSVEEETVILIGRRNQNAGPLCNLTDGGEGVSGLLRDASPARRSTFADGLRYESLTAAALACGCSTARIIHRIRHGWPGYYYEDEGQLPRRGRRSGIENPNSRAVVADNVLYETLTTAASALGIYPSAAFKRIAAGWAGYYYCDEGQQPRSRPQAYSLEHFAPARERYNGPHGRAVIIDGRKYPSMRAAGRVHGLTGAGVRQRCKSPRHPAFVFA